MNPERWSRYNYQPSRPLGKNGCPVTASKAHIALSRRAAAEGMVLLKNEGAVLPLAKGAPIAVFGRGQIDYIRGGGGSSMVTVPYTKCLLDALFEKQREGKVRLCAELADFYENAVRQESDALAAMERKAHANARLFEGKGKKEPEIPEELMRTARTFADTAIIVITRFSSEKFDRNATPDGRDFYLSAEEAHLIDRVSDAFAKTAVVLNIGGLMDVSWFCDEPRIGAALLAWLSGMEGGGAVADILTGDVTPSGRLTDTVARSYSDYPTSATFSKAYDYVAYTEDIFVGYRYFETFADAASRVVYPFGYGLSYTTFALSALSAKRLGDTVTVCCTVENTGSVSGKEVVQVYASAPQGKLGKPKKVLVAFGKTRLLAPGGKQTLHLRFPLSAMASFDDLGAIQKSAFLLEAGEYTVFAGSDIRSAQPILRFDLSETVVEQLHAYASPQMLTERLTASGAMQALPIARPICRETFPKPIEFCPAEKRITLFDVANGKNTVDELIAQMTVTDIAELLHGNPTVSVSPTNGIGGGGRKSKFAIPLLPTADGPSGLRIPLEVGLFATAFPCATQLACTFDEKLVERVFRAMAAEIKENNIAVFLAPGLNIHRDPLCGRSFEYFSEDPLLSGRMAIAAVNGIQSMNVAATVKHFACNGKEENRRESDSRVSERALREIYLKGFEMVVKGAKPYALMTAYNRVNGVRSSQHYELIECILRGEWGFDGVVMTDWHVRGEQTDELLAGNDVKMPECIVMPEQRKYDLAALIAEGKIPLGVAQQSAKRVLELILKLDS